MFIACKSFIVKETNMFGYKLTKERYNKFKPNIDTWLLLILLIN